jgi:hypothetical protein
MKKLLIVQPCIVQGGKVAERGDVVEADERTTYVLISSGRALDMDTKEARELKAEIDSEKEEAKSAAKGTKK